LGSEPVESVIHGAEFSGVFDGVHNANPTRTPMTCSDWSPNFQVL